MSGKEKKSAFIVTPIGPSASEVRRATDGLIQTVLRPVLTERGYGSVKSSHEESDLGSITQRVIKHLLEDDLVIVNLTTLNANVMYELGIRHATAKPIILIAEDETDLPFDTKDQRTIIYKDDMMGVKELRDQLEEIVSNESLLNEKSGNPVYMSAHRSIIEQDVLKHFGEKGGESVDKNAVQLIFDKLDSIEQRVSYLDKKSSSRSLRAPGSLSVEKMNSHNSNFMVDEDMFDVGALVDDLMNKDYVLGMETKPNGVMVKVNKKFEEKAKEDIKKYLKK